MRNRFIRTLTFAVGIFASLTSLAFAGKAPQNAATAVPAASGPAPSLAGSSTCRECHASFYEKWATSHHGLAMQPFTADLAARQLKSLPEPIAVRGCRYRVDLAGGKGWVVESGPNAEKRYVLEHALGGKNVFYFLTPMERGRLQVLPVAYDVRRQEWFDTTASAARGQMHFEDEVLAWRAPQLTFNTSCHGCHMSQWRPRDYQRPVLHIAGLVAAARQHDWTRLPEMLAYITNKDRDEVFAAALVRLVSTCEDASKWPALAQAAKDSSPLVRAAAAEGLDNCPIPDGVAAVLAATGDEYRLVRIRAAASLAGVPREQLSEANQLALRRATEEFLAVTRARPDDAAPHYNLGNYYTARREFDLAVASFERAVQLLPDNVAPLVNAAANLNLGLLLGERGRLSEAETSLRAALKSDPQSVTAAYNLGVVLAAATEQFPTEVRQQFSARAQWLSQRQ